MSREINVLTDAPFRAREAWSRANDLLATGTTRTEKTIALRALHEPLAGKRRVTSWHPIMERIMQMHLDLCVELNDLEPATTALESYKKLTQNVNTASLNEIITRFVNNLTSKLVTGKLNMDKASMAVQQDLCLEEALRCASYVDDDYREMIDRRKLLPQESRAWDAHRFSIDILRGNPKLMLLFLNSIQKGAAFCAEHRRKSDLRDLIRHTRKSVERTHRLLHKEEDVRRSLVSTPEVYHAIMDTWLKLFEVASAPKLMMWPEAYKIVEYMNFTMQEVFFGLSSKPHHLIAYSEAVVQVFGASTVGPHELYHAYALYYLWKRKTRHGMQDASLPNQVVMATLRITESNDKRLVTSVTEKTSFHSHLATRWMNLLALKYSPKWSSMVSEIQQLKPKCDSDVQQLCDILVQKYLTADQYDRALAILDKIKGRIPGCDEYNDQIRKNALIMMVSTLMQMYSCLHTKTMAEMCRVASFHTLEPILLKIAITRREPVVIDELHGIVMFQRHSVDHGTATLSAIRCATLSVCDAIYDRKEKSDLQDLIRDVQQNSAAERQQLLLRLELTEKRRIAHDTMQETKRMEEHHRKIQKDQNERDEAALKFTKERLAREEEKKKETEREADLECARVILTRLETILNMKYDELHTLDDRKVLLEKMLLIVQEAQVKMTEMAYHEVKRMDYFVRALRETEASLMDEKWAQTSAELISEFELRQKNQQEMNARTAANAAETRERLSRMNERRLTWEKEIITVRENIVKEQTKKRTNEQKVVDQITAGAG